MRRAPLARAAYTGSASEEPSRSALGAPLSLSLPRFPLIAPNPARIRQTEISPALLYATPDGDVATYLLRKPVVSIGSADDNDIILAELQPHHARIEVSDQRLEFVDLNTDECRHNDRPVTRTPLQPGDQLRLGSLPFGVALKAHPRIEPSSATSPTWHPLPGLKPLPTAASVPAEADPGPDHEALINLIRGLQSLTWKVTTIDDFELLLETAADGILPMFSAARAFCVLFEEDGRNPLLTIERHRDERNQDDEEATTPINESLMTATFKKKTVVRLELPPDIHCPGSREAFAAPILYEQRMLGLLYFDRPQSDGTGRFLDEYVLGILAQVLARPIKDLLGIS